MSCHSTPCHTNTSPGCGVDLCSTTKLSTNSVIYTGPTLSCSGISACDTLTDALQKLDYRMCNLTMLTFTANNGITKILNNFQLGGPLVQQTVITTTAANCLVIAGLAQKSAPDFFVSQDSSGTLTKTTLSSILSNITASNGITRTGDVIQLGGNLIKPTVVTTTATNTLKLAGLVTDASPAYIITQASTGELVKTLASSIIPVPTVVTADNGLTKTSNNIQLGGSLISPTTLVTTGTNTLSITGLSTDNTPDFILTETTPGVVKKIASSTLTSNVLSTLTANNGLTKTGTNVKLGGALIQNTLVDLNGLNLSLLDSGAASTGLIITPGSANPTNYTTNSSEVRGKLQVQKESYFQSNVGVGYPAEDPSGVNTRLFAFRRVDIGENPGYAVYATTESRMALFNGTDPGARAYNALAGNLYIGFTANQTLLPNNSYTAIVGEVNYSSRGNTTGGSICAFVAGFSLGTDGSAGNPTGNLDKLIGYRVKPPQSRAPLGWNQTLTDFVGVQIDDVRTQMNGGINGTITNSWGIRQLGVNDANYFNGAFQLPSSNVSIGTATLVAGTVTVNTTAAKTGSKIFLSVNTPGGTQGFLSAPAASITNGVSFVINSSNVADTSTVNWWIINS